MRELSLRNLAVSRSSESKLSSAAQLVPLLVSIDFILTWNHRKEPLGVLDMHTLLQQVLECDIIALLLFFEVVPGQVAVI